jgi:hypothetical protein
MTFEISKPPKRISIPPTIKPTPFSRDEMHPLVGMLNSLIDGRALRSVGPSPRLFSMWRSILTRILPIHPQWGSVLFPVSSPYKSYQASRHFSNRIRAHNARAISPARVDLGVGTCPSASRTTGFDAHFDLVKANSYRTDWPALHWSGPL